MEYALLIYHTINSELVQKLVSTTELINLDFLNIYSELIKHQDIHFFFKGIKSTLE